MNVRKEYYDAKIETFLLMHKEDEGACDSPYLFVIDKLENIIECLLGMSEEESEQFGNEACDEAYHIIKIMDL